MNRFYHPRLGAETPCARCGKSICSDCTFYDLYYSCANTD
jgi:hypothetical protein